MDSKPDQKEEAQQMGSARRTCPVTELNTWLQHFAVCLGVISLKHSEVVPELIPYMVAVIQVALFAGGIKAENYAGHRFWTGSTTAATSHNLPDSLVKTLGKWKSAAYILYIRAPQSILP